MKHVSLEQLSERQFAATLKTEFEVLLETGARIPVDIPEIQQVRSATLSP